MKKIFIIIVLIISYLSINAQVQRPSGLPSPNSTGYGKIGYQQADSGYLWSALRDTFPAKFKTTIWHNDGNFYKTLGNGAPWTLWVPAIAGTVRSVATNTATGITGGTITTTGTIAADTATLTTRARTKQQTDSLIGLISSGGGGTVLSVGISGASGIDVTNSPITSTGVIGLSLGNATPSSLAAAGAITGATVSISNIKDGTGDFVTINRSQGGVLKYRTVAETISDLNAGGLTNYLSPFSATSLTTASPYTNLSVTGSLSAKSLVKSARTDINQVFEGDSRATTYMGQTAWPTTLMTLFNFTGIGTPYNVAVGGSTIADLYSRYTANVYPRRPTGGIIQSNLFVMIGINNIQQTATPNYGHIADSILNYCNQAKTDGFTVYLFSAFYEHDLTATQEIARKRMNDSLRAGGNKYFAFIDLENVFLPQAADPFYLDVTHLNSKGNDLIAYYVNEKFPLGNTANTIVTRNQTQDIFTPYDSVRIDGDLRVSDSIRTRTVIVSGDVSTNTLQSIGNYTTQGKIQFSAVTSPSNFAQMGVATTYGMYWLPWIGTTYNYSFFNRDLSGLSLSNPAGTNNWLFSDTARAASIARVGGTSSQYLMADGSISTGTTQYLQPFSSTSLTTVSPYTNFSVTGSISTSSGNITVPQGSISANLAGSGSTIGGASTSGTGVQGTATTGTGVLGGSTSGVGVIASNNDASTESFRVVNNGAGVLANFQNTTGTKLSIGNSGLVNYTNNLGSSYTSRSLVDKNYVDSVKGTITTGVTGTGTTNTIPKWTSSTALGNSLITDDGSQVVINTVNSFLNNGIATSGNITMLAGGAFNLYNSSGNGGLSISNQGATGISKIVLGNNFVAPTSFTLQGSLTATSVTASGNITTSGDMQSVNMTATSVITSASLTTSGNHTMGGLIQFNKNSSPGDNGQIGIATTYGLYQTAKKGASFDYFVFNGALNAGLIANPTATNNLEFGGNIQSNGVSFAYRAVTTTATVALTDYTVNCTSGTFTVTLPTAASAFSNSRGQIFVIKNSGAGVITLAANGAELIDGSATQTLATKVSYTVQSTSTGWIIL